jgi:hypothetical protein
MNLTDQINAVADVCQRVCDIVEQGGRNADEVAAAQNAVASELDHMSYINIRGIASRGRMTSPAPETYPFAVKAPVGGHLFEGYGKGRAGQRPEPDRRVN